MKGWLVNPLYTKTKPQERDRTEYPYRYSVRFLGLLNQAIVKPRGEWNHA